MVTLLEITGDDVAELKDDDLRALIGLLCEADYRMANLPTKGITWGGHQDAKDGGLDVVVRDIVSPPARSHVPRSNSGFQVKKQDMSKAAILNEMRPEGVLRPSIKALIAEKGAYIIVSASGSVADTGLTARRNAMKEAVKDEENNDDLYLDFLDRGRVATWIRSHPSMIFWVRNKIGKPIKGWRPYENWANSPRGLEEEYLLDDGLILHDLENPSDKGCSVADGLSNIRAALAIPRASVRLIGLSGVGKTRFVQALFDSRVGEHALNPLQTIYTDISDGPEPDPVTLVDQLINDGSRGVLIVDNCPPDLHRRLTRACSRTRSTVSIITVEYDVRDDIPEERTSIFQLEPASKDLIERLISKRFPDLGQVNAGTIAKFSDGNARVALLLANTVRHGETLSGFRDEELFKRLFWQRHKPNEALLVSAQACALVYSFQGEDATSELRFLGSLIGKSGEDMYRDVATLKQRELVQSRGILCAVLPHAIANKLAKQALESIPKETLINGFLQQESKRLMKSFTRRLSYLHDSDFAVSIVESWLGPDGWVGKSIHNLNRFDADVLNNIAPVSPAAALSAIERAANGEEGDGFTSIENARHRMFVRLLRHLAYDADLFTRSVNLIIRFALTEDQHENEDFIRNTLRPLFYMGLSGTHASMDARAAIIQGLLDSDDMVRQKLGLSLLNAALEAGYFSVWHEFEFGARPRDFGYSPKSKGDVVHWLSTFMDIGTNLALSDRPSAKHAKRLLADKLPGLWSKDYMRAKIERVAERLLQQGVWNEGWLAVQDIIRFDSKDLDEQTRERILSLEKQLKPQTLLEKARTFALSDKDVSFVLESDFNDDEPITEGYRRAGEKTREIGAEVARNREVFQELLPALVSTDNARLCDFGQGLAEGAIDKRQIFQALHKALEHTPREQRVINVIRGFLWHLAQADSELFNAILDESVGDDVFGEWFLNLQTVATIDQRGVKRLHEALDLGNAPIHTFQSLAWGRYHESITDDDLANLLAKILTKDDGIAVAVEILRMRFHRNKEEDPREYSESLINMARKTLAIYPFEQNRRHNGCEDHALANIAATCLGGSGGADPAKAVARNLADAMFTYKTYIVGHIKLCNKFAELQPNIFLDEFLGREDVKQYHREKLFWFDLERRENPLRKISDDVLIAWCEMDPSSRYTIAIATVNVFEKSNETERYEWRPIIYSILSNAPELEKVLEKLGQALRPSGWSGSRADILENRSFLLIELQDHKNAEVASWAKRDFANLQQDIAYEREREQARNRDRNERFE